MKRTLFQKTIDQELVRLQKFQKIIKPQTQGVVSVISRYANGSQRYKLITAKKKSKSVFFFTHAFQFLSVFF